MGQEKDLKSADPEQLAKYIKANTELQVDYDKLRGIVSIPIKQKIDALAALAAAEQSKMEWGDIQTRRDSLDDVFVKLVSGKVGEHGEILDETRTRGGLLNV